MIKSRGTQDIGSNETTKEEKNNFKKGERGGKPGEQRAEDIPVHMPTMSHNDATPAMLMNFTQNSKEAFLRHCLDRVQDETHLHVGISSERFSRKTDGRRSRRPVVQA